MPDLSKGGRIRDPVHGYVLFTGLERAILDLPVAQRLRYVAQSGMAQLVFPEVRSSRFAHSLGAMHLASRFFASSLHNAEPDTCRTIERGLKQVIDGLSGLAVPPPGDVIYGFTRQGLQSGTAVEDNCRHYALLAEQGLRLAALFHDLGHLPYSHDFEYSLGRLLRAHHADNPDTFPALTAQGDLAIHERIGYRLAELLMREVFATAIDQPGGKSVEVCFLLAQAILQEVPPEAPGDPAAFGGPANEGQAVLQWLHSLVAGEIDVDRCDYILRDTRHYGFEFVSYDVARLIDNLTVVPQPDSEALVLAVQPQGTSAAESFLIARFRMYQWGIRHHKVTQAAAALQKVIRSLLEPALESPGRQRPPHPLRQFLEDIEEIAGSAEPERAGELLARFATYDDVWWMGVMREANELEGDDDPWLRLVCSRAPGPETLWKRILDFPPELALAEWNAALPDRNDDEAEARWSTTLDELEQEGILIVRHHFSPWRKDPDGASRLKIYHPEVGLVPLTRISYMVESLQSAWMSDIQVHAFAERNEHLSKEEVLERLTPEATADV